MNPSFDRVLPMAVGLLVIFCLFLGEASAQSVYRDGFESPESSWQENGSDVEHKVLAHRRVRQPVHSGQWSEHISITAGNGTFLFFSLPVGQARIIEELRPRLWVRSDRSGIRLLARVVLPNTQHPRTGKPVSTIIYGTSYSDLGKWQELRIDDVPKLVERQARVLRLEIDEAVDTREAYIDRIALNVYGGLRTTNVWIDDLELSGFHGVAPNVGSAISVSPPAEFPRQLPFRNENGSHSLQASTLQARGGLLQLHGAPVFIRMVDYNGEPLAWLKRLGFNAVHLSSVPRLALLREAQQVGMGLVCPPPGVAELEQRIATASPEHAALGPEFDVVWAWDVGEELSPADLEKTTRWSKLTKQADYRARRPVVCGPKGRIWQYSRQMDVLTLYRRVDSNDDALAEFSQWVRQRQHLARPGTPFWVAIDTQQNRQILNQWRLLGQGNAPDQQSDGERIRRQTLAAMSAGVRGVHYRSRSRLNAPENNARLRAAALELANMDLQILNPWAAAGRYTTADISSDSQTSAVIIHVDRAQLVLPILSSDATGDDGQKVGAGVTTISRPRGNRDKTDVVFTVAGIPESYKAYDVTPAGFRPVREIKRVAGGMRVRLERFDETTAMVFTDKSLVVSSLARRIRQTRRRAAELQIMMSEADIERLDTILSRLANYTKSVGTIPLANARIALRSAQNHLANSDPESAYRQARDAARLVWQYRESLWKRAGHLAFGIVSTPYDTDFAALPEHWRLVEQLRYISTGPNLLAGGDFESLDQLRQSGWEHAHHHGDEIITSAELTSENVHAGRYSLRLEVRPVNVDKAPSSLDSPAVWITTPEIAVDEADVLLIDGWINIDNSIKSSSEGFIVLDSLTAENLTWHARHTQGWQPFTMVRAAPRTGSFSVTFALDGFGSVQLDNVMVRKLSSAPAPIAPPMIPSARQPDLRPAASR